MEITLYLVGGSICHKNARTGFINSSVGRFITF
ncbi:MAG: hypothetical protein ACJAVW_003585, partial [Spirosomataceae bacterium]